MQSLLKTNDHGNEADRQDADNLQVVSNILGLDFRGAMVMSRLGFIKGAEMKRPWVGIFIDCSVDSREETLALWPPRGLYPRFRILQRNL